jgi:hypothetical protein
MIIIDCFGTKSNFGKYRVYDSAVNIERINVQSKAVSSNVRVED